MIYRANGSHSMMNTTGPKTSLNDLKSAARAKNYIFYGNTNIFERDVPVSMGGIVITVHGQHSLNNNAWCV